MVETVRPRAISTGIRRRSKVVLPAPLQPASPITRIGKEGLADDRGASKTGPCWIKACWCKRRPGRTLSTEAHSCEIVQFEHPGAARRPGGAGVWAEQDSFGLKLSRRPRARRS